MSTPDPIPSLPVSELDVELIKTRRSNGDLHSREDYGGMDPYWHLGACIDALVVEVERLRALVPLPATPTEGRLLSALKSVTEHMDRAGGDGYGMPECPWCRSQLSDDHHNSDCELAAARELLAEIDRLRALVPLPATPTEDRYYALRDAVTMSPVSAVPPPACFYCARGSKPFIANGGPTHHDVNGNLTPCVAPVSAVPPTPADK